jgi:hypothetical protein
MYYCEFYFILHITFIYLWQFTFLYILKSCRFILLQFMFLGISCKVILKITYQRPIGVLPVLGFYYK